MLLTNRPILNNPLVAVNGAALDCVQEFTYLGICIDSKLKYTQHIQYLTSKLSSLCGATYRLRFQFNLAV